jgi:hypothetical protein
MRSAAFPIGNRLECAGFCEENAYNLTEKSVTVTWAHASRPKHGYFLRAACMHMHAYSKYRAGSTYTARVATVAVSVCREN